ncbi:MAG TPA: dihydrolipoamide acetyltransferase family protein [Planctomycetota bacterium]|jgi:pyruvate dehydrogenase E2 component (dihydrolipoamide acetyltransferase)|nr:dihydrolipoamide acetyltransferase family protein [Planctomycetota bacterium]
MPYEFRLPDIGEGVAEGEVTKWMVQPGDAVREDQPLVEVMTDKATVEIPSPVAGKVLELRAKVGEKVPVEAVLLVIEAEGGRAAKAHGAAPAAPAKTSVPSAAPPAPAPPRPVPGRVSEPAAAPASARMPGEVETGTAVLPGRARVLAAPATRRLARELGIELATVAGTGPHGRVTKEDLHRAGDGRGEGAVAPPSRPPAAGPLEERIPLVGLRRKIAEQMRKSKSTAAHFTIVDEADVTELVALREQAAALAQGKGVRITYLPFVMKALVAAMREFPHLNATMDEERGELVVKRACNFGVATDTDRGLIVPVVKDVASKTVFALAGEIQALAEKARAGKIALGDLRDGTFSITSAGSIGTLLATPIINVPEVAILGVHKIQKRPVVRDGQVVVREMVYLSVSLDHRVIDGATATRFLNAVIRRLEHPALLFLEAP